jgi:oxaloacetate decarboxylase beta subunit
MKKVTFLILFSFFLLSTVQASDIPHDTQSATVDKIIDVNSSNQVKENKRGFSTLIRSFYHTTGIYAFMNPQKGKKDSHGNEISEFNQGYGKIIMILIAMLLFYLAIAKGFEPLLLIPIGFGGLLANIPLADIAGEHGFIGVIYEMGIANELFPIIIFMGVGAMTDFGPLLANPKTAFLGGAAQFGIFGTLAGAAVLSHYGVFDFTLKEAAAISIIGGADGPTSIFIASKLAPDMLGAIAVSAYSYMALVPIIQPPIMRALTSKEERQIVMVSQRTVSQLEKIFFPITVLVLCILILPEASPLIGALCFGNFVKESGVVERLSDTLQNALINIVTILLGLGVGSKLAAEQFLVAETLGILILGLVAFSIGTAAGVIMAKIMNKFSKDNINPLIGAAGVSAVPMAARVVSKVGMEEKAGNILLMHAMGPNVAGVIGSAVAAGVLISIFN